MNKQIYQGDIPVLQIEKLDKELEFRPLTEPIVVADGEISGHKHVLIAERESICEIAQDQNGYYLNIKSGSAKITHPEHQTVVIDPGLYFIGRQWEFNEIEERKVLD